MTPWIAGSIGLMCGIIIGVFAGLRMAIMVQRAYATEVDLASTSGGSAE